MGRKTVIPQRKRIPALLGSIFVGKNGFCLHYLISLILMSLNQNTLP